MNYRDRICTSCGEYIQRDYSEDDRHWSCALPPIEVGPEHCPYCEGLVPKYRPTKEDKDRAFRIVKDSLDEMIERHEKKEHYR